MINGLLLAKSQILVRFKIIEKSGLYGIINSIKEVFSQAKKHFNSESNDRKARS